MDLTKISNAHCEWQHYGHEVGYSRDFRDVQVNVLGINHCTFIDHAVGGGRDWLPDYLRFAAERRKSGWRPSPIDQSNEFARRYEDQNQLSSTLPSAMASPRPPATVTRRSSCRKPGI